MSQSPSQPSTCWPDDPDWLNGATWIDAPAIGGTDSGCYFDTVLLKHDDQSPGNILDIDQALQVRFRVEARPPSEWDRVSGTWNFDLAFTEVGGSSSFNLSEILSGSLPLQVEGWSGKDTRCIEKIVTVPPGTLPRSAKSTVYELAATVMLQPTSGLSKPTAGFEPMGTYMLLKSESEPVG